MTLRIHYIANIRLPTEKAHGLQIMHNCEAFAGAGAEVSLWVARRVNTPALRRSRDVWAHYGVERSFSLRRLPCLDLIPLVPGRTDLPGRVAFYLQLWTFTLAVLLASVRARTDVYYSRDAAVLLALSLVKPRSALAYEAHRLGQGAGGRRLQRRVLRRVGTVIAVTAALADDLIALGADPARVLVAHDGIRAARFRSLPTREEARRQVGWPEDAFIVGYVGRLETMAMDKGVGTLINALRHVDGASVALVGGPDRTAESFRARWLRLELPPERFLYTGQVAPEAVPVYLAAFDVCVMPFPDLPHFARHASPMKLFEYMASRRPIVASDLPAVAEVVRDGTSALLVPAGDTHALADAIVRLRDNAGLRRFLADSAYERVMSRYTWDERARRILDALPVRAE